MGAAALLLSLTLATATAQDHLAAGVAQYEAGHNQAALGLFLAALDAKGTRIERAKARLYIGVIQHEAGSVKDAEGSFELALRLSSRLRLPARASRAANQLFAQVKDRLGIKTRVRKTTRRKNEPPPPPDPNVLKPLDARQRAALSGPHETRPDRAPPPGPNEALATNVTATPEDTIPTSTWIIGSAGAVAVIAAITLSALATSTTNSAYQATDVASGADKQSTAKALHTASVASFATGGLLFGAAAVTLAF